MWNKVEGFPPQSPLFALETAFRPWHGELTLLQAELDNFALLASLSVIKVAAAESENLEISNLSEDSPKIVFLSARPSAARELFVMLEKEAYSSWLLASTNATFLTDLTTLAELDIQSMGGNVSVRTPEGRSQFSLSLLSKREAPQPQRFEPVKQPIGETSSNLSQRAEWFKRRSGR